MAALFATLWLAGPTPTQASRVHAAAAPLPGTRLEFGLANQPSDLGWMTSSGVPWKYRYQYLAGGVNTGHGWETWNSPAGAFATFYMDASNANAYIPVFSYYELLQSTPSSGANESDRDYNNLNNTATMAAYYANFKLLMQKAGAFGQKVVVHVEPDLWGYLEQRAGTGDASTVSASVASSGFADVTGIPNTAQGFAWALLHIRDLYASNAVLAIHASAWAGGDDIASSTSASLNVLTFADATAAFLNSAGISSNPHGSTWDVVFNDLDDHDAAWWEAQGADNQSYTHWWDPTNTTYPNFARYLAWVAELKVKTGRQQVAWQVPVGNQYFLTMNNTCGHYQDNVAQYFIANAPSLYSAGLAAVLFGSGNACQTNNTDAMQDGITNNNGIPTTDTLGHCSACNTHASTSSDDDGGFLRIFVGQYYSPVPGAPTNVVATGGDGSSTVNWSAPGSAGGSAITSYVITAYDGCTIQGSMTVTGSPPPTTAVFTGLTNGTAYTFTVTAANSFGTGPPSAASNAVIPSGAAPSWLTACSTAQQRLTGNNGSAWANMDAANLKLTFTPAADSYVVLTVNADLWTANAGFNQDIGISVTGGTYGSGTLVAWKESGGLSGTFSPNAAFLQTAIPVTSGIQYTATVQWKASRSDPGTIYAGAGPVGGAFSPTRLTAQIVPTTSSVLFTTSTTAQPCLQGNDGISWQDVDPVHLSVPFSPPAGSWLAFVSGNGDLFASTSGYNQDLGVLVSGGAYGSSGTLEAWKESGGPVTYSPNAAFVQAAVPVSGGIAYTARLQWKASHGSAGGIHLGAGPIGGKFSPTTLSVLLVPNPAGGAIAASTVQHSLANSDGATWQPIDLGALKLDLTPSVNTSYAISGSSDLWTSVLGYNQDLGVKVSGGAYSTGTVVAWKESGGAAGTFSPNAAFVTTDLHLQAGIAYTVWLVWKANRPASGSTAIWAGAGPITTGFSPTSLSAVVLSQP